MTTLFPFVRKLSFRCFLLFSLVVSFACSKHNVPDEETTLRVAVSVEISSLDPQITTSIESIKIQSALYETLVKVDAQTGKILPGGCESWDISADHLKYTFHLRKDAKWSSGEPVIASDYAFAFERLLHPELGAPFANLYDGIVGAVQYREGGIQGLSGLGVEVVDADTLVISLSEPVPYFLSLLARPCVAAIPRAWILANGAIFSRNSGWSLVPDYPVCGAYRLKEWSVNKWIHVEKNHQYWNQEQVEVESIVFYPIESAYAQERGFRAKALDVTSKLASEQIRNYLGTPFMVNQLEMGTFYVIVNTQSPPLHLASTRQLLSQAINREVIANELRQRGEAPAYSFCPPLWGETYASPEPVDVFPLKPTVKGTLKLLISPSENNNMIAEALQAMWKHELGVDVEIIRQEWKSYLDSRNRGKFDLCLATWIGDYYDPLTFLEMWKSQSPNNFCRWSDTAFDKMIEDSSRSRSAQERLVILSKAEKQLMDAQVVIPIFYLGRVYLVSDQLKDWPQSILNTIDYSRIRRNRN